MEIKVVTFVFFTVLLHGSVNLQVVKDTKADETGVTWQRDGEAITMVDWEILEKAAYYINFRFFARNIDSDFDNADIVETTYRNVNLDEQPKITYYTHLISKEQDLTIIVGDPGTYKFRFRLVTKQGNSSWTEWHQFSWSDHSNFTGAPEIMRPSNNSIVDPGLIIAEWRAPPDADGTVTNYKVLLLKRISDTTWKYIGLTYVDHVVNKTDYISTFNDNDNKAFYKLTIMSFGSTYEGNLSAPVYFTIISMLDWKVLEKGAYYIDFRFFARDVDSDFRNADVVATTYRNVNLEKQAIITYYTYMRSEEEDLKIFLDGPGTYKFRFQLRTKLGNSSWSEWHQYSWRDHSNFTGAPEILRPSNNSVVDPRRITTEWRAPPDADETVTKYRVLMLKRISNTSWLHIGPNYVEHVVNKKIYTTSFNDNDNEAFYKLTVTSFGLSYESNVSSPVYFTTSLSTDGSANTITRSWVTVLVSVLCIVLLSL